MEDIEATILRIPRGREFRESSLLADDDDNPIDLTGCGFAFTVRYKAGGVPLVTGAVTITDATGGEIETVLSAAQVAQLTPRVLHWQLDLTDSQGAVQTIALGTVIMEDTN